VLIDFWAKSCVPCRMMEKEVLGHPAVARELERFVLLKVDVDQDMDRGGALRTRYRSTKLPELVVLDSKGKEVARAGKVERVAEMLNMLRPVQ